MGGRKDTRTARSVALGLVAVLTVTLAGASPAQAAEPAGTAIPLNVATIWTVAETPPSPRHPDIRFGGTTRERRPPSVLQGLQLALPTAARRGRQLAQTLGNCPE
jgi:hypothetical protein